MADGVACPGEAEQQTAAAPGPIIGTEIVVRVIIHPLHAEADGTLKNSVIRIEELKGGGASLVRKDHLNSISLRKFAESLVAQKADRSVLGCIAAPTKMIRDLVDEKGIQVFCVLDDGDPPSIPEHALISWSGASQEPIKKFRGQLVEALGALRELSQLYDTSDEGNPDTA